MCKRQDNHGSIITKIVHYRKQICAAEQLPEIEASATEVHVAGGQQKKSDNLLVVSYP